MKKSLLLVIATLITFSVLVRLGIQETIKPIAQENLSRPRIFAYPDWQSIGIRVQAGDQLAIKATGVWLYTPGEYHGPEGSPRYRAPSFYPLPHVPGGALLGRIGDKGDPFYVGRGGQWRVDTTGILYLRIDDDILSDNDGWVMVEVTITQPEKKPE